MVVSWGSSATVISRISRNIKNIDADAMEDIKEWIAEAVGKMKTPTTVAITPNKVRIDNHRGRLPCKIEALVCIENQGCKLSHNPDGNVRGPYYPRSAGETIFMSISPIYTTTGELTDINDGRSKYPRDILVSIDRLPIDHGNWYRVNGKSIECSISSGYVIAYTTSLPKDDEGFPLIPEVEEYEEAIYRYVRMMLIEAGYEDKVISHSASKQLWEEASGRAISAVSFPTPDEVAASINRNVQLFISGFEFLND